MRSAIEQQVIAKQAVTAETREVVGDLTVKGLRQLIRVLSRDPSKAEAMGEKLGQSIGAALVKRFGKRLVTETVKGAERVLDSI